VRRDSPGSASAAWRRAAARGSGESAPAWEPEQWIDEDVVREQASKAVVRGGRAAPARRDRKDDDDLALHEVTGRALAGAGVAAGARLRDRLRDATRAYRRERYDEARRLLQPLAQRAPGAPDVRELLGLTYYRLGRWRDAIRELEAFRTLTGSTEQNPVLADSYRALHRYDEAEALWEELRDQSPSAELVAEGRIVAAGARADQGDLRGAIRLLERAARPVRAARPHHLRIWYALADLYERAGDVPKARQLFSRIAAVDPDFVDVRARFRNLR
jgi:tetratricopeptide (TPR) repeat protein